MKWADINGFEGKYKMSEKGEVKICTRQNGWRTVKSHRSSVNTKYITLWKNEKRKNYMLHKLYAETFDVPVETAKKIVYEGFEGKDEARENVKFWLDEKIKECEELRVTYNMNFNDEILYLKSFISQVSE